MSPPIPNSPAGSPPLVRIPVGEVQLDAELDVPPGAHGLVIFAHGTGSGRLSPRNSAVAQRLRTHALATLLVDLLTAEEDIDREKRFDIQLLIGYFGASTGAAAALNAAANRQKTVRAVVSRGGRVDLAKESLASLKTPTLFAVGQNDFGVLEVNEEAFLEVPGTKELAIIPHATHLFEEPGTLDRVAQLAAEWFNEYLGV